MTDKLNQEIKIKAKQVTEDLINFMQDLDTENNYQIKELERDIEYYKSRIEELETENERAKELQTDKEKLVDEVNVMQKWFIDNSNDWRNKCEQIEKKNAEAKEIIRDLLIVYKQYNQTDTYIRAERFLKE